MRLLNLVPYSNLGTNGQVNMAFVCWATLVLQRMVQKEASDVNLGKSFKTIPGSDCSLKFESMKEES